MCNNRILGFWNKCFLGSWPRIFGESSGTQMPESHWNCALWVTVKYWIVPLNTYDVENFICLRRQRLYLCFRNNLKPGELQEPLRGFSLPFHWKVWTQASYTHPVYLWKWAYFKEGSCQSCLLHVAWMILSPKHMKHRKGVILGTILYIFKVRCVGLVLGFLFLGCLCVCSVYLLLFWLKFWL